MMTKGSQDRTRCTRSEREEEDQGGGGGGGGKPAEANCAMMTTIYLESEDLEKSSAIII
jgi:hypothetical protein